MRLVIADDHALFRDGLRSLLEAHGFRSSPKPATVGKPCARRSRISPTSC